MNFGIPRRILAAALVGVVGGFIGLTLVRFALYKPVPPVHHHANFALYVNGVRDEFDNFTFYEEVQSCNSEEVDNPKIRVHMHDNVNSIVHVHDNGVTWGQFFANLGYGLSNKALTTDQGVFVDSEESELQFILNGEVVDTVANRAIKSEDTLLIDYGTTDPTGLQEKYASIPKKAGEFNQKQDPASCRGNQPPTFTERLKSALGVQSSH